MRLMPNISFEADGYAVAKFQRLTVRYGDFLLVHQLR